MVRAGLVVVALLLGGGSTLAGLARAATAPSVDAEHGFTDHIAAERSSRALGSLVDAGDLQDVARRHAQRMAERGEPYHNPNLGSEVQDWDVVSENVGTGSSVQAIHDAFMASRSHREVILSREHTQLGIGVVQTDDGQLWVVEVFRRPSQTVSASAAPGATPAAAPAPQPSPAPAPAPQPRPVAASAPSPAPVTAPLPAVTAPPTTVVPPQRVSALTLRRAAPAVVIIEAARLRAPVPEEDDDGIPPLAVVAVLALVVAIVLQVRVARELGIID